MRRALAVLVLLGTAVSGAAKEDCPEFPAPTGAAAQLADQFGTQDVVHITWTQVPYDDVQDGLYTQWNFKSYRVERHDAGSAFGWTKITAFDQAGLRSPWQTEWLDYRELGGVTRLLPGHTYEYRISVDYSYYSNCTQYDGGVIHQSATSSIASVAIPGPPPDPASPTNLRTQLDAHGKKTILQWDDNASDETGFEVERSVGGGEFARVKVLPANTELFTDKTPASNTTYGYRVRAVRAAGPTGYTNTSGVTTPLPTKCAKSTLIEFEGAWELYESVDGGALGADGTPPTLDLSQNGVKVGGTGAGGVSIKAAVGKETTDPDLPGSRLYAVTGTWKDVVSPKGKGQSFLFGFEVPKLFDAPNLYLRAFVRMRRADGTKLGGWYQLTSRPEAHRPANLCTSLGFSAPSAKPGDRVLVTVEVRDIGPSPVPANRAALSIVPTGAKFVAGSVFVDRSFVQDAGDTTLTLALPQFGNVGGKADQAERVQFVLEVTAASGEDVAVATEIRVSTSAGVIVVITAPGTSYLPVE